jgi:elongation factor Ts
MAEITASQVKELRECTGAGMMECKKALVEAEGNLDTAVDILRTRGLASLAKKAGRATNEGTIAAFVSENGKVGVLVEVNCETDFVGINKEFTGFAAEIAEHVAAEAPSDVENLLEQTISGRSITISELFGEKVSKLGENMGVARFVREEITGNGAFATYIHGGGKIGILATFTFNNPETAANAEFQAFAKDVAMQIAASAPINANRDEIPADIVEHELSIYRAQAAESGKPEPIQQKMAEGRLEKFYKEVVLTEQVFVKNPDITVGQYAAATSKAVGDTIAIGGFERWVLGESASE